MGNSASNNVNTVIDLMTKVHINIRESCSTNISQNIEIEFINGPGGSQKIEGNTFDFSQSAAANSQCQQSAQADTVVKNTIDEVVQQTAKAVGQMIAGTEVDASNAVSALTKIGTQISTSFSTDCQANVAQNFLFRIENKGNGTQTFVDNTVSHSQFATAMSKCVQTSVVKSGVTNEVSEIFSQLASSKTENLLGPLFGLLIAIALVIGMVLFGGEKILGGITNSLGKMLPLILSVLGLYMAIAAGASTWPINHNSDSKARGIVGGIGAFLFLAGIVASIMEWRMTSKRGGKSRSSITPKRK
jgi:hypothetical protein